MTKRDSKSGEPSSERALSDKTALRDAFAGVTPLDGRARQRLPRPPVGEEKPVARGVPPDMIDVDSEARQRLGALVAGNVRFDLVVAEDGRVRALRDNADARVLTKLVRGEFRVEAELDLHGLRANEVEAVVVKFLRFQQKRGRSVVRVIHGKGLHSEGGVGVLGDKLIRTLIETGAAPVVQAFATPPEKDGGRGVLVIKLVAP